VKYHQKGWQKVDANSCPFGRMDTVGEFQIQQFQPLPIGAPNDFATVAAINLERVSDWLAGIGREKTRRSAFARVMQPLTA
jgi:hypothetical protein